MTLTSYADSALSLLPPVVAILLAILTRRVLLSLGLGILIGALLLNQWSVLDTGVYLGQRVLSLVWDDGAFNAGTCIFWGSWCCWG